MSIFSLLNSLCSCRFPTSCCVWPWIMQSMYQGSLFKGRSKLLLMHTKMSCHCVASGGDIWAASWSVPFQVSLASVQGLVTTLSALYVHFDIHGWLSALRVSVSSWCAPTTCWTNDSTRWRSQQGLYDWESSPSNNPICLSDDWLLSD